MSRLKIVLILILCFGPIMSGEAWANHGVGKHGGGWARHSGGWDRHGGGWDRHGGGDHFRGYGRDRLYLGAGIPWGWGDPWPYYDYPSYYSDPYYPSGDTVPSSPPAYIENEDDETAPADQPSYWYYCSNPQGYYPYIRQCTTAWQPVATQPQSPP